MNMDILSFIQKHGRRYLGHIRSITVVLAPVNLGNRLKLRTEGEEDWHKEVCTRIQVEIHCVQRLVTRRLADVRA